MDLKSFDAQPLWLSDEEVWLAGAEDHSWDRDQSWLCDISDLCIHPLVSIFYIFYCRKLATGCIMCITGLHHRVVACWSCHGDMKFACWHHSRFLLLVYVKDLCLQFYGWSLHRYKGLAFFCPSNFRRSEHLFLLDSHVNQFYIGAPKWVLSRNCDRVADARQFSCNEAKNSTCMAQSTIDNIDSSTKTVQTLKAADNETLGQLYVLCRVNANIVGASGGSCSSADCTGEWIIFRFPKATSLYFCKAQDIQSTLNQSSMPTRRQSSPHSKSERWCLGHTLQYNGLNSFEESRLHAVQSCFAYWVHFNSSRPPLCFTLRVLQIFNLASDSFD